MSYIDGYTFSSIHYFTNFPAICFGYERSPPATVFDAMAVEPIYESS